MSTTVDQRVVEMKFDNRQFESGVRESMSTLDKLKQALNFNKMSTGLENIGKEVAKVDMSGLATATETVTNKFSVLEVMAVTALVNITNSAINTGKALIKNLTIDQLNDGWSKFESKTESVKTIMSATRTQFSDTAQQMAVVNEKLDELNWFTDETSYNFTDMVSNIGKFTSAGVDLDTASKSMQGIATWAAMSGANAVTASRAMYNLAQAIGVGYVKLIDWKTIENCNMATMEFKQTVLDTAVELGTLKKEADGTYKTIAKGTKVTAEAFSESLSEGWFTNNVLTSALNEYEKATEKLHQMADSYDLTATEILGLLDEYKESGSDISVIADELERADIAAEEFAADLDVLSSEEYELSLSAFKAAQQATTFTDVINATKDAVSTGWMKTFEYIFGNYQEAVQLFSDLCEVFWELFASGSEARNEMLRLWKAVGGRETLLNGIYKAFSNIKMVLDAIGEAWDSFFGKEPWEKAANLTRVTDNIAALFEWLEPTTDELSNITDTFKGLFSILDLVSTVLTTILKTIFPMIKPARGLFDIVLQVTGALGHYITENEQVIKSTIETSKVIETISKILKTFVLAIVYAASKIVQFLDNIDILSNSSKVISVVMTGLTYVFKGLAIAIGLAVAGIVKFVTVVKTVVTAVVESFKTLVKSGVNAFKAAIIVAKEAFISLINALKKIPSFKTAFERLGTIADNLKNRLSNLTSTDGKVTTFFERFKELIKSVGSALGSLIVLLAETLRKINPIRVVLLAFVLSVTLAIHRLGKAFKGIPDLISAVTDTFVALRKKIGKPSIVKASILEIAVAIGILAASIYVLANYVDQDKLWTCVGAIAALSGILLTLTLVTAGLNVALAKISAGGSNVISLGTGLLTLAASVMVLVYAMKVLSNEVNLEDIWTKLGVLGAIATGLVALSIVLAKLAPTMSKDCLILLAFAVSISSMVKSLKTLAEIERSPEDLLKTVESLTVLMVGLAALSFAAKGVGVFSAVGLVALVLTFKMVLPVLEEISKYNYDNLKRAITDNITVVALVAALATAMTAVGSIFGGKLKNFGIGLLMMAAAVGVLVQVMKSAQALDSRKFHIAAMAVGECLVLFGLLEYLSKYLTKGGKPVAFAASLVIMSAAVAILVGISKSLGDVSLRNLAVGELAVIAILGMVALLERLSWNAKNIAGVAKVLAAVSILAIEMSLLSLIPWEDIIPAAAAMGIAMVAFGAAIDLAMQRKWNLKGVEGIIVVTGACVVLGAVMSKLASFNWRSIMASGVAMGLAMYGLAYVYKTISGASGFNDTAKCLKKVGAALGLTISMIALAYALSALASHDWVSIGLSTAAMAVCFGIFSGALNTLSNIKASDVAGYKGIIAMALVLVAMGTVFKMLTRCDWPGIIVSFGAIIVTLGYLWGCLKILNKFDGAVNPKSYVAILSMGALLLAIGGFINLIQGIEWQKVGIAGAAILGACAGLLLVFIGIRLFAERAVKEVKKTAKAVNKATVKEMYASAAVIASLALGVVAIAGAFALILLAINKIGATPGQIFAAIVGVVACVGALALAVKVMNGVAITASKGVGSYKVLLTLAAAILAIGGALYLLSSVSWGSLLMPLASMIAVLGLLTILVFTLGAFSNKDLALGMNATRLLIPFTALLLAIGGSLWLLSTIGYDEILQALASMGAVFVAIGVIIGLMHFINPVESSKIALVMLGFSALILSVASSLALLAGYTWGDIGAGLGSMILVMTIMSALVVGLACIAPECPAIALVVVSLVPLLLAYAASLSLLAGYTWDQIWPALVSMLGISVMITGMVAILAAAGPTAALSFPMIAGALLAFAGSLVLMALLDWDAIWYGFTTLLKIAGIIGLIVIGFTLLTTVLAPVGAALATGLSAFSSVAVILAGIVELISITAGMFAVATALMAGSFLLMELVDFDMLARGFYDIAGPLALLGAAICSFILATFGVPALLLTAAAFNAFNNVNWNEISLGMAKVTAAIGPFKDAVVGFSLGSALSLILIANGLTSISNIDLNTAGTGLYRIGTGLQTLTDAITEYETSGTSISDVANQLIEASVQITAVANTYDLTANRIVAANSRILLSSTFLGSFMGQGLLSGLTSSVASVNSAMSNMADQNIAAYALTAGIHSPSTRMAEMGGYLMQGVSEGVRSEAPNVYKTMDTVSDNTVKSAAVDNGKMYKVGQDAIKSQNKGMVDEARDGSTARTVSAINNRTAQNSGEQLKVLNYQNGVEAESAKLKGTMDAAPTTAKVKNDIDESIMETERETYETGGEIAGESGMVATAEGASGMQPQMSNLFGSFGTQNAGSWWDAFKRGAADVLAGFVDFVADILSDFGAEDMANDLRDVADTMMTYGEEATEAAGATSILDTMMTELQNTMDGFGDFSVSDSVKVNYGKTIEYQKKYKDAVESGNKELQIELAKSAGTMVEISKYSEDYYKIMGYGTGINYDFSSSLENLTKGLDNFGGGAGAAGEEVDEFTQKIQDLHSNIESQIDAWNEFDRTIDITSEDLIKNLQSQISGVNEWSNKILVLAQRGISKGILEELANMGPQGYKYVEAFIQMTGEELATVNDLWIEKGTLSASSTLAIQAAYALAGDEASKAYVEGLGVNLEQIQNAAQQLGDSLAIEATPEALRAIDAYKETFKSLYDSIESSINIFEKFNMETETSSEEILENMKSQIEGVTKWSENLRILGERGISDGLLKELSALGPDGYDKVNAFVEMTQSQLEEANDLYAQSLELPSQATANVLSGYAQAGDESAKAFIEALGASVSDVDQIGTYILEGLEIGLFDSEATQSLATTANNVGLGIIQQLMTATDSHSPSEKARQIGVWVDMGLRNGLREANDLPTQACTQMAEYMMQGLINGISSGSARVVDAMVNVCMEAKAAAERALDINSPSRVFAQIGKYTVMGFSEGIDQNAQMVVNSTEEMGNASINTLKDALTHARDLINGDIDNTITLTPVLDLTNVRAGVQQINGMMNASSVSANVTGEDSDSTGKNQNGGMTFIQNNYSPKALNRIDIYRQTKNQFAAMKGLVSGT